MRNYPKAPDCRKVILKDFEHRQNRLGYLYYRPRRFFLFSAGKRLPESLHIKEAELFFGDRTRIEKKKGFTVSAVQRSILFLTDDDGLVHIRMANRKDFKPICPYPVLKAVFLLYSGRNSLFRQKYLEVKKTGGLFDLYCLTAEEKNGGYQVTLLAENAASINTFSCKGATLLETVHESHRRKHFLCKEGKTIPFHLPESLTPLYVSSENAEIISGVFRYRTPKLWFGRYSEVSGFTHDPLSGPFAELYPVKHDNGGFGLFAGSEDGHYYALYQENRYGLQRLTVYSDNLKNIHSHDWELVPWHMLQNKQVYVLRNRKTKEEVEVGKKA